MFLASKRQLPFLLMGSVETFRLISTVLPSHWLMMVLELAMLWNLNIAISAPAQNANDSRPNPRKMKALTKQKKKTKAKSLISKKRD